VTASRADRLVDRLPEGVSSAAVAAAKRADLLVLDSRTAGTRTERTGEAEIAGRRVLVVPERPGARPRVACYSRDDPDSDPAIPLVRRTVELDATTAAHYDVAAAVADADGAAEPTADASDTGPVAHADGGAEPTGPEWVTDAAAGSEGGGTTFETAAGIAMLEAAADGPGADDDGDVRASVSPSAAELAARRDSVDTAAERVLSATPETAAPLAFCGLAGVVEPLEES
jgi:hypothetical protein